MIEYLQEPVAFFLLILTVILITPLLSEKIHLPGIVGIILGGMLIGPNMLRLLDAGDRIEFLSTIGLVYLMFSAGLEVDIHQFVRVRGRAIIFGILTFSLPQLMGIGLGRLLGLDWLGSILLGSAFASHTLIAFPILTRLGVTHNEAVAVTAGATVLTDIGAFVILAVVLGAKSGQLEWGYFVQLLLLLVLFTIALTMGLPRLGKFFFKRLSGRAVEFQFVLVVLFVAAFTAELIGVHEVVGAFLAGLAVNATLPRHSPVTGHVLFIGESFFIPIFLLYSGMITNPFTFFQNGQTVLIALGVTFVAYGSKLVAAWLTKRIFHYTRNEFLTVYGLSHAQAAVTIPTLVIGVQAGLFNPTLFDAAIMMILLTSITSPLVVQRFAPGLQQFDKDEEPASIFARILVPVVNPQTQEQMLTFSNLLTSESNGKLMVLNVVRDNELHLAGTWQRELLARALDLIGDPDAEIEIVPRVGKTYAQGILHAALERDATLIIMGWRGKRTLNQNILGSILDEVIWEFAGPVMVGKFTLQLNSMQRVVLFLPPGAVSAIGLTLFLEVNFRIAKALNIPLHIMAHSSYFDRVHTLIEDMLIKHPYSVGLLGKKVEQHILEETNINDLISIPGFGSRQRFMSSVGNLPERLATAIDGNMIILHINT